jgi:hypothetical protein
MTVAELRMMLEGLPDDMPVAMAEPTHGKLRISGAEVAEAFLFPGSDSDEPGPWLRLHRDQYVPPGADRCRVLLID